MPEVCQGYAARITTKTLGLCRSAKERAHHGLGLAGAEECPIGEMRKPSTETPMQCMKTALLPLIALMALSACETIQGAGRDLSTAGNVIARESQEVQQGL